MGIIRKQGLSTSILIYIGFALGAFNILVLFPKYLSLEQAGLVFLFVAIAKTIQGFASLGGTAIMNKFFPYYYDYLKPKENDYLVWSFFLPSIGAFLSVLILIVGQDYILQKTVEKSPLFSEYYFFIIPFSIFMLYYTVLETFAYTRYRTVFASFIREIVLRLITTVLVWALVLKWIDFDGFVEIYALSYFFLILLLGYYLYIHRELIGSFRLSKITRRLRGKMVNYGMFVYGGYLIAAIAENADVFIIGSLAGLGNVAVYQTGHYISTIIQVPYRSLSMVAGPVIAKAWKDRDIALIQSVYSKSSMVQLLASLFLFGAIWINIDWILGFLGENFSEARQVVLLLGLARVIDLGFGHNVEVLINSKYWKFNFQSYVLLVLIFLPTNYFLVKAYGITGSALANIISFTVFNLVRFSFLWVKCGLQPFSYRSILVLGLALTAYFISDLIHFEADSWGILLLVCRTMAFAALFLLPVFMLQLSTDFNQSVKRLSGIQFRNWG